MIPLPCQATNLQSENFLGGNLDLKALAGICVRFGGEKRKIYLDSFHRNQNGGAGGLKKIVARKRFGSIWIGSIWFGLIFFDPFSRVKRVR